MVDILSKISLLSFLILMFLHVHVLVRSKPHGYEYLHQKRVMTIFMMLGWILSASILNLIYGLQRLSINLIPGFFEFSISISIVNVLLVTLVSFLALVIYNYSETYLDSGYVKKSYYKRLSLCFLSSMLCVSTTNLIILLLSWVLCSFNLQKLLTLYSDKNNLRNAQRQAKVFFRASELFLLISIILLGEFYHTLDIQEVTNIIAMKNGVLPFNVKLAGFFVVMSVILKTAMFPFNGWVIKVMDAPTPVSALLHAAIINMGGYILITFAPILDVTANTFLFVISLATTVLASLAMKYQTRIKCKLAWSTCAQMGFMLFECALGIYQLAFIHLICHSIYKAHAFLYSGNIVEDTTLYLNKISKPNFMAGFLIAFISTTTIDFLIFGTSIYTQLSYIPHWILTFSVATLFGYILTENKKVDSIKYITLSCVLLTLFLTVDKALVNHFQLNISTEFSLKTLFVFALLIYTYLITSGRVFSKYLNQEKFQQAFSKGLYVDEFISYLLFKKTDIKAVNIIQ